MIVDIKERNLKIKLDFKHQYSSGIFTLKSFKVIDYLCVDGEEGVTLFLRCKVSNFKDDINIYSFYSNKVLKNNFVYRDFKLDTTTIEKIGDVKFNKHLENCVYCEIIKGE